MFHKATKREYMYLKNNKTPFEVSNNKEYLLNKYAPTDNVYYIKGWTNSKKEAHDIEYGKSHGIFINTVKYNGRYYILSQSYNLLSGGW